MLLKRLARRAAAIVIVCLFGTNVSYVAAGEAPNNPPQSGNSRLGGWVYIDRNNDGILNFSTDPNPEWMIGGVRIELYSASAPSTLVDWRVTDEFGRYLFDNLSAGTYTLKEIQPIEYVNGKSSPGEIFSLGGQPLGGTPGTGNDSLNTISGIVLPASAHADYYLFGERGFAAGFVSKRFLTGRPPVMEFGDDEPGFGVPEPATLYLVMMATAAGLIPWRRRRRE